MKRFLIAAAFAALAVLGAAAQEVRYVCDPATVNKSLGQTKQPPLSEEGGWVAVPATRCRGTRGFGVLVYHCTYSDDYYAYDLACPMCLKRDKVRHRLEMETDCTLRCRRCWSEFQNISLGSGQQTNGPGTYDLKTYNVYKDGKKIIVSDKIIQKYLGI